MLARWSEDRDEVSASRRPRPRSGRWSAPPGIGGLAAGGYNPHGPDAVIDADVLWACTTCGACVEQCPVDIEHVDTIVDMRRYQVLIESAFPTELNGLFRNLEKNANPWGMEPQTGWPGPRTCRSTCRSSARTSSR